MIPVLIGVIVAIVIVLAILFASKKKKSELPSVSEPSKPSTGAEIGEPAALKQISTASAGPAEQLGDLRKGASERATDEALSAPGLPPEDISSQEPIVTAAQIPPGVRLDEKAEDLALAKLDKERRERKLKRLRQGLAPTRSGFVAKLSNLFKTRRAIDPALLNELEEVLLTSDVGTATAKKLLDSVRSALDKNEVSDSEAVLGLLREAVREILKIESKPIDPKSDKPFVIMVVGVNGVGKTTTIGKLATKYAEQGYKIILAAADTFRAAAVNQLTIWGRRANAEVIKSKEGADPSSVVFDAIKRAKETDADIVIVDTAGRLHTKQPLMDELKKVGRVIGKAYENAPQEVLLVLDATTGQNAIQQVAMFKDTLDLTGLVLTKLDGTAKGGVIIGICNEHAIPVRFIGIGESKDDLREFDVTDFIEALFAKEVK